jgi:hypothetical protein
MKICNKCNIEKNINEFAKDKSRPSGYCYTCRECYRIRASLRQKENRTKHNKQVFEWRQKNKETFMLWRREYEKARRKSPNVRIIKNLRVRIRQALINFKKTKTTEDLLGCTITQLRQHLESKFQPNMSWDNYGQFGWHIDHIIPLSKFDLSDPTQLAKACHYTNLQPLWWQDNLKKSNHINL